MQKNPKNPRGNFFDMVPGPFKRHKNGNPGSGIVRKFEKNDNQRFEDHIEIVQITTTIFVIYIGYNIPNVIQKCCKYMKQICSSDKNEENENFGILEKKTDMNYVKIVFFAIGIKKFIESEQDKNNNNSVIN
ncbi:hypothetical protein B9Z55_027006 [Caenorhabditis nigoni]|uniref:Uncharacterized protein n=1 Tax=Caenorhabditis nigoni TaxID=1611254 RepID=A0A2G5SID7_9PELO|nr:hypothetical protein B9Z55_027006 [Caenorhabditis nigoni]